jgi:hypothetical protein
VYIDGVVRGRVEVDRLRGNGMRLRRSASSLAEQSFCQYSSLKCGVYVCSDVRWCAYDGRGV